MANIVRLIVNTRAPIDLNKIVKINNSHWFHEFVTLTGLPIGYYLLVIILLVITITNNLLLTSVIRFQTNCTARNSMFISSASHLISLDSRI